MSLSRSVFNHSQVALSVIVAGMVYQAAGGNPTHWPQTGSQPPLTFALIADSLVNYLSRGCCYMRWRWAISPWVVKDLHLGRLARFAVFYAGLGLAAARDGDPC